jgi:glycosyltransferase 2 family protein
MPDDRPELSTTALGSGTPALGHPRRPWLGWSLTLGALAGCLLVLDVHDMLATVRRMRAHEIAFVLALVTGDRVLMALKWRLLLGIGGAHLPALAVIRIYYQGWLMGAVLPSHLGGDLLRAHLVARRTGVGPPAFASLVMEKLLGLVSAVNGAIAGGVIVAWSLAPEHGALWISLGALAALACNGLVLASLHGIVHDVALGRLARARQTRVIGMLHRCYAAYAGFSRHPKTLLATFGLTGLEHGLQLLILCTIATGLGIVIEPVLFVAAAALQMLMVRLPIAPDGWGTGELAAVALFGLIGISAAAAFTLSVVSHVLGLVAALLGVVVLGCPRAWRRW